MKHITGKIIITIGCFCLMLFSFAITTESTLAFLTAIIISYADYILPEGERNSNENAAHSIFYRYILDIFSFGYIVIGWFCPPFMSFYPLILYNTWKYKYKIIPLVAAASSVYMGITGQITFAVSIIILGASGIYISYLCSENEKYEEDLIRQRDQSVEYNLLLKENNRQIIANQDGKIYAATLKERNRIAREIHDNVGHMLTRSILQAGAIKALNKDVQLSEHITNLQSTLDTAMTSIRTSVHDLHDDSIDLKSSIADIAEEETNLKIDIDYDMSAEIPRDIKYAFISIIKEAINNTQKHSNADKVHIILREHPGFYQLMVADNGKNVVIKDTGIGLTGMKERISALGGTIKFNANDGFSILVSIMKGAFR